MNAIWKLYETTLAGAFFLFDRFLNIGYNMLNKAVGR